MLLKLKLHDVFTLLKIQQWLKVKANITQWTTMYYIIFFSTASYLSSLSSTLLLPAPFGPYDAFTTDLPTGF